MGRREIALFVALAAAAGGVAVALFLLFGASERTSGATRASAANFPADRASAPAGEPALRPEAAVAAGSRESAASEATSGSAAAAVTVQRELEAAEEVDFPGLIDVSARPADVERLDGTLVLKNADPAAPPLRLEIPVRNGRFRGRGPVDAVVTVEKLVLSGHEACAREASWKLASRWLQIDATIATPFVLHVVDAASGRELNGVTLRGSLHREGDATREDGAASGEFTLVRAKRSTAPPSGFDAPLELAAFGLGTSRSWFPDPGGPARYVIAHAPGHGDEGIEVAEQATEATLRLHAAASLRATVTPWPRPDGKSRFVFVARRIEAAATTETFPPDLPPRLAALAREAIARRDRRVAAAESPQRHAAEVDAHGGATFEDLGAGEWVAWVDDGEEKSDTRIVVNGRRTSYSRIPALVSGDPLEFTAFAGGHVELVLRGDAEAEVLATLTVRAVDATSGEAVALAADEVSADALDDPDAAARAAAASASSTVRSFARFRRAADRPTPGDALLLRAGIAAVHVVPRAHPQYERVDRWVELAAGANDVVVPLPRGQGIVVSVATDKAVAERQSNWFEEAIVRLVRDGADVEPATWWNHGRDEPMRFIERFAPLEPGRYALIVPDGVGYDREGEIAVEVRAHEITTVELKLDRAAATADDGG